MRTEITSAADFLVDLVRAHNSTKALNDVQLQKFRNNVCDCLARHYVDHWFPSTPMKGSGYRCIRINGKMDPLIARAGCMMGLAAAYLRAMFPSELTMWVDPSEVSYRIGENGSICVLYEDKVSINLQKQQQQQQHQTPNTPPRTPPPTEASKHSVAVTMLAPPPSSPPPSHHQTHLQHHHHHHHQQQQQHHHHQHHQQHFSPSKSMIQVSTGGHQNLSAGPSPPLSPVSSQQQAAQQQAVAAMQLSMFLPALAHQEKANLAKCKESLRLDATRSMLHDRLFVSSWVQQVPSTHVISTTTPTVEKYNQGPSDGAQWPHTMWYYMLLPPWQPTKLVW